MLATAILLTPMILAAEPVQLEMLDQIYDHRTQTSTVMGNPDKRLRLAWTNTSTQSNCDHRRRDCPWQDGDLDPN